MNSGTQWPDRQYRVIYADPPWRFETYSASGRGRCADNHYEVLSRDDLLALPVADLCHPEGTALLLWTTSDQLGWAVGDLMPAWGFQYKSLGFVWVKMKAQETVVSITRLLVRDPEWHGCAPEDFVESFFPIGLGYYTRQQAEICLLGTTSKVPERLSHSVRQVVVAPRREHSRKPDQCYDRIEGLFPGPYLELFARTEREGWDAWGDEVESTVEIVPDWLKETLNKNV